jgi:hypothetical protein
VPVEVDRAVGGRRSGEFEYAACDLDGKLLGEGLGGVDDRGATAATAS